MTTWRERLVEGGDIKQYRTLARSWLTCAVGEQRALYPEIVAYLENAVDTVPGPEDLELLEAGSNFYMAIESGDVTEATSLLDRIEARVAKMKREYVAQ